MRGRITGALLTALVGATFLVPGSPAQAADGALPISTGPGDARRDAGPSTRIIGGRPVPDGAYPFQAALLAESFGDNDHQRQYCGGSLISPFHVLTAAHCVDFIGDEPGQLPLSDLRVVVGRTVLSSAQGERRAVVDIAVHPQWSPETFSYDAAVITLAAPVLTVRPVRLVTPGTDALERPGTQATVTGWGNTIAQPAGPGGGGTNYPDRMQQATVPIVSRADCRTAYAAADAVINATMLCAGRTNRDTCQGDSGGPLFLRAVGTPGFIQVGITSWGLGCGATGFPGVYTRLGNRRIGNFVLQVTGGVPVAAQAAAAAA
jgi:secreted trypsin-like serine protease